MTKANDTFRNTKKEMLLVAVLATLLAVFVLSISNHMRIGQRSLEPRETVTVGLYQGVLKELRIATGAVFPSFALLQLLWAFACIRWLRALKRRPTEGNA